MKKLLLLLWLFPAVCLAQTDSTQIKPHYIYCRMFFTGGGYFSKVAYRADYGKKSSSIYLSEDERRKLNDQLASCDNEIDALNYMDLQGWEFVSFIPPLQDALSYVYLLRKRVPQ